jgi:hypothetical protein
MSRTFRRKQERHEYYWVLHDWEAKLPYGYWVQLDPRSRKGRNDRMLRRWLSDPDFDPVFRARHNHDANWNWW